MTTAPEVKTEATSPTVPTTTQTSPKGDAPKKKVVAKQKAAPVKSATSPAKEKGKGKKMIQKIRKPGPAMIKLQSRIKLKREIGVCGFRGCAKKTLNSRAKWCQPHKKAIRKLQLKENNKVWHHRVKLGKAGHHVVYRKHVTEAALKNPDWAKRTVKSGHSIIQTVKELEKVYQRTPQSMKKAVLGGHS